MFQLYCEIFAETFWVGCGAAHSGQPSRIRPISLFLVFLPSTVGHHIRVYIRTRTNVRIHMHAYIFIMVSISRLIQFRSPVACLTRAERKREYAEKGWLHRGLRGSSFKWAGEKRKARTAAEIFCAYAMRRTRGVTICPLCDYWEYLFVTLSGVSVVIYFYEGTAWDRLVRGERVADCKIT